MGIYKKNPPFNHIFGRDRILSAWYRGIKNAGPRKRAQGRAQDMPYISILPYHHGIWRIFVECGKKNPRAQERARAKRKGSYPTKKQQEFSTFYVPGFMHLVAQGQKPENILYHYRIRSMGCQLVVVFGPFCSEKKSNVWIVATNMLHNFTRVFHRGMPRSYGASSYFLLMIFRCIYISSYILSFELCRIRYWIICLSYCHIDCYDMLWWLPSLHLLLIPFDSWFSTSQAAKKQIRGLFFIPGIDIGLVYSAGMTELMSFGKLRESNLARYKERIRIDIL